MAAIDQRDWNRTGALARQFGGAVGSHSAGVIGGWIVTVATFIYTLFRLIVNGATDPWTALGCIAAVLLLFFSCFLAWRKEHLLRIAEYKMSNIDAWNGYVFQFGGLRRDTFARSSVKNGGAKTWMIKGNSSGDAYGCEYVRVPVTQCCVDPNT